MKKFGPKILWQIFTIFALILVIAGFFYFELSWTLRILVILLGISGLIFFTQALEYIILVIFYLGLYDLYNIRYGLAVPLSLILLITFILSSFLFYLQSYFNKGTDNINKNIFNLYLITSGLITIEIFLTMSFWPVDPKTKSLVIVIVYYLISKIFYLYINNVLHLKKVASLIIVSILILGGVIVFGWWFGY